MNPIATNSFDNTLKNFDTLLAQLLKADLRVYRKRSNSQPVIRQAA